MGKKSRGKMDKKYSNTIIRIYKGYKGYVSLSFFLSFSLSLSLSLFLRSRGRRGCPEMNARRTETILRSPMTPNSPSFLRDIRFRARIPNSRGDHVRQHKNKYLHPKDTRFRACISNTRADLLRQQKNKSIHSKDIRFRARISNTRGDH